MNPKTFHKGNLNHPTDLPSVAAAPRFGEVKLGLLVSEALESEDLAADDMAAMLRLIVSILASRPI